ncbi:HBS1-like protein, partial [Coelomomyces lativittatus]
MSRHRFLKEFEREAYEELYAEDDQTDVENDPEFQSKLKNAMNELKSIIGDSFDNAEIEETLCYYQLNIKKSIRWLLEGVDPDTQPKKVDVNLKKSTDLKQTTLKPSKQDDKVAAARAKGKTPSSSSTSKPSPASHETKAPQSKSKPPKKNIASSSESKLSTQMTQLKVTDPITNPSPPVLKKSQQELHQAYQLRRAQLNLVVIGHVDAGKSTLLGHFLNLTGHVETKQIQKYEHQATQIGKKSFQYAWVMDENEDERQRGVTMTLGYVRVETQHKVFNFMDAPGHQDWVPHMISGAGMADVACLVVDSSLGAFEKGLEKGQTKEHGLLMKAMGVASVLVLVNKMDRIDWDPTRFHHIQTKITQFLSQLNYNQVTVIPVSGLLGENLIQKSSHVDWYHGPCFLEALDQVKVPERALFQPFRLRVSEKKANWVHGQIDTGSIQVGEPIVVLPHQTSAQVRSIQIEGTSCKFAVAGDQVGIQLTGIDGDVLAPHDVLCAPSSPIAVTDTFECKVVIFDCLVPITPGFPFLLHQGSVNESGHVKALLGLIDKSTGNVLKKGPKCATKGST